MKILEQCQPISAFLRASSAVIGFAAAAAIFATSAYADQLPDLANGWDAPNGNPVAYELDYFGDVTSLIPPQVTDDVTDPWAWFHDFHGKSVNPTTVTYDSVANLTRVVLSGDPLEDPVPPDYPYYYLVGGVRNYHTGLNEGFVNHAPACLSPPATGSVCLVSRHWIYASSSQELDALSVTWKGKAKAKHKLEWLLTYIGTADPKSGQERSGFWKLTAWDPVRSKTFIVTNTSGMSITVDRIGYQTGIPGPTDPECQTIPTCDQNEQTLDSLLAGKYPPPGDKGSEFISLPLPKTLKPGKSYKFELP